MTVVAPSLRKENAPDEPKPEKRFFCPSCRQPKLAILHDGGPHVARCVVCSWATDDLLALIPTRLAGFGEVALGTGATAILRVALFAAACAGAAALALVGR